MIRAGAAPVGKENGRTKGPFALRNVAKGAGVVVLGLVALDLLATIVTIAVGSEFLKK